MYAILLAARDIKPVTCSSVGLPRQTALEVRGRTPILSVAISVQPGSPCVPLELFSRLIAPIRGLLKLCKPIDVESRHIFLDAHVLLIPSITEPPSLVDFGVPLETPRGGS